MTEGIQFIVSRAALVAVGRKDWGEVRAGSREQGGGYSSSPGKC